jgi:hypothetical protein
VRQSLKKGMGGVGGGGSKRECIRNIKEADKKEINMYIYKEGGDNLEDK